MTTLLLALLLQAGYDDLVARGVEEGRNGHVAEAQQALDQAIRIKPGAAAAWRERGGLNFLRKDYRAAARDLERAFELQPDPYTARMLGSSLHLLGHPEEALEAWNEAGVPLVRLVRVSGDKRLPRSMVRREVTASEGGLLTAEQLRESRLRLEETGSFSRITLRPVPLDGGKADLEVSVKELHGLGSWFEVLGRQAAYLFSQKTRLRYQNLFPGITLGAEYKWEKTQPKLAGTLDWVRPLGFDLNLRAYGVTARPQYDLDGLFTMRTQGADVGFRRVLGPATVGELGFRTRTRTFTRLRSDTPEGRWSGVEAALERHLLEEGRHQAVASVRYFHTLGVLGSNLEYGRALGTARYVGVLSGDEQDEMPRSVVAARLLLGWGDSGTPLDEMFAPGAASEMDYPLRGHRQKKSGVLGRTLIGRRLALLNLEWRWRVRRIGPRASVGTVLFYDGARVDSTAQGRGGTLHDIGAGLRVAVAGVLLRADYGFSVTGDSKNSLTVGLGQAF